jgi:glycosyltransferase involved in cell wall biosynthesis
MDAPFILYVGRLEKEKGVLELLEAFARLQHESAPHLVFVGDGTLRGACDTAAAQDARIHVLGARPIEVVADCLGASDILALPSWNEGTPNVVLEAFASARPVVASRVGGIPDILEDGTQGFLCSARDSAQLAARLSDALSRQWSEQDLLNAAPGSWQDSGRALAQVLHAAAGRELPTAEPPLGGASA